MKISIINKNGKSYIELPEDFNGAEDVELSRARDGLFVITFQKKIQQSENSISDQERAVLQKLLLVKFEKRTPVYATSTFTDIEQRILKEMERKKFVNVFYGGKYKATGVFNINDRIYPLIAEKKIENKKPLPTPEPIQTPSPINPFDSISRNGYVIIQNERDAFNFSENLKKQGKQSTVYGLKGFDGKFYVAGRSYFEKFSELIKTNLKEDANASELALKCKTEPEGCTVILYLLSERGEVIEKRKGLFSLA